MSDPNMTQSTPLAQLRAWKAQEGVRQSELLMQQQTSNLTAMETRATSILAWSVAGFTALALASNTASFRWPMVPAAVCLAIAGLCCVVAMWPREWCLAGQQSLWDDHFSVESITRVQEVICHQNNRAIDLNDARLRAFSRWLRRAWCFFLGAPASAALMLGATLIF